LCGNASHSNEARSSTSILAGPLAGRLFDRIGGRWPLTLGFVVLAASGIAWV